MTTIKIRLKQQKDVTRVRTLITHPMETGRRRDAISGNLIPAHFITKITLEHKDKKVVECSLGTAISKNPYFSFKFRGGKPGDKVRVGWVDNRNQSDSAEAIIS